MCKHPSKKQEKKVTTATLLLVMIMGACLITSGCSILQGKENKPVETESVNSDEVEGGRDVTDLMGSNKTPSAEEETLELEMEIEEEESNTAKLKQAMIDTMQVKVEKEAVRLNGWVEQQASRLQTVALVLETMDDPKIDELTKIMAVMRFDNAEADNIYFGIPNDTVIMSDNSISLTEYYEEMAVTDREWYTLALQALNKTHMTNQHLGHPFRNPTWHTTFSRAVSRNGRLTGVLAMDTNIEKLLKSIDAEAKKIDLEVSAVVLGKNDEVMLIGEDIIHEYAGNESVDEIVGYIKENNTTYVSEGDNPLYAVYTDIDCCEWRIIYIFRQVQTQN